MLASMISLTQGYIWMCVFAQNLNWMYPKLNTCFMQSTKTPEVEYFLSKKPVLSDETVQYFLPTREGFERVRHERFAFHCDAMSAFPAIHNIFDPYEICDLNMVYTKLTNGKRLQISKYTIQIFCRLNFVKLSMSALWQGKILPSTPSWLQSSVEKIDSHINFTIKTNKKYFLQIAEWPGC